MNETESALTRNRSGPKPGRDFKTAKRLGISKRQILALGGAASLHNMGKEARALMIGLARKSQRKKIEAFGESAS